MVNPNGVAEIEVSHLVKDYGRGAGVFDVSFEVQKGEVFGFLGPNGSGKTTTIRHLMGFSAPQSGYAKIRGLDSRKKYGEILNYVGYLPGELALPAGLNGWEFIRMMQNLRRIKDRTHLEMLIERFDLNPDIPLKSMSLGEKRKLAIVTAFMADPDILILDEPTSGLDPIMQEIFINFVKEEKDKGKTIFLSSHIFSEVDATCDRISIIKDGKIVSTFRANDLKHNKNKTYRLDFYTLEDMREFCLLPFDIAHSDEEWLYITLCINDADIAALTAAAATTRLKNFSEIKFSLSDYFMKFYAEKKDFGGLQK